MAREPSDREDLLREATALIQRAELTIPGFDDPVVIGFRRDGAASFYFGADPVYQFNSTDEFRRAYIGGLLYKAERGRFVALTRERSASETALIRRELSADETTTLLTLLQANLDRILHSLDQCNCQVIAQVPNNADIVPRIRSWLAALKSPIRIANTPNVH